MADDTRVTGDDARVAAGDVSAIPAIDRARKGIVIGILILVLLVLTVYFYWRGTGFRDETGRRPPPPAQLQD